MKTQHRPKVSRTLVLFVRHLGRPLGSRGAAEGQVPPRTPAPISREGRAGGLVTMSDGMSFPPHISNQTKPPHPRQA